MSKKNFVSLMIGTIGIILFTMGMCMTMLEEWNAFNQGVIIGVAGLVCLIGAVYAWIQRFMIGIVLIIPALFGLIQSYCVYRRAVEVKQQAYTPVIERKKKEIQEICEKGKALI